MVDLREFVPLNNDWIKDSADKIGWDQLTAYYDSIYLMLLNMERDEVFDVEKLVRPENYELFIRCACTAILELGKQGIFAWSLNEQANRIVRDMKF